MIKNSSLQQVFGNFAKTLAGAPIRYLVIGETYSLSILDLTKLELISDYDFEISNMICPDKFENMQVQIKPSVVLSRETSSGYDYQKDTFLKMLKLDKPTTVSQSRKSDKIFNCNDIIKILKFHFVKNSDSDVIYRGDTNVDLLKQHYEFFKYETGSGYVVYSPGSHLLVRYDSDIEPKEFGNLKVLEQTPDIDPVMTRSISVNELNVIQYCMQRIK